jgi:transcriptional regulator with XRE-family HTH domain
MMERVSDRAAHGAMGDAPAARAMFAENVRRVREQLGLSQAELAERGGLHRSFVSAVERGVRNISIDNMDRLAAALRTTVAVLLTPAG